MINLQKGGRINLNKGVSKYRLGLSWDAQEGSTDFDLDAWALGVDSKDVIVGSNGKVNAHLITKGDDVHFTFYNNLTSFDEAVTHSGDNRTGSGDGDDEVMYIEVAKLDSRVQSVIFGITIHDAVARHQNFGQVKNPKVKLYIEDSEIPELVYELDEDYSDYTCLEVCSIYKNGDSIKFRALGQGNKNSLEQELIKFNWPENDIQS